MDALVIMAFYGIVWFGLPFLLIRNMSNAVREADQMKGYPPLDAVPRGVNIFGCLVFGWLWVIMYFFFFYIDRHRN